MIIFVLLACILAIGLLLLVFINYQSRQKVRALNISNIDNMSGIEFEEYISMLLKSQGFTTKITKASNDFGADIIASIGKDKYSIQLKRYSHPVDRTAISDAVAAMTYYGCNKSMVITTNYFTKSAVTFAKLHNCDLIDRTKLTNWILKFQNKQF